MYLYKISSHCNMATINKLRQEVTKERKKNEEETERKRLEKELKVLKRSDLEKGLIKTGNIVYDGLKKLGDVTINAGEKLMENARENQRLEKEQTKQKKKLHPIKVEKEQEDFLQFALNA